MKLRKYQKNILNDKRKGILLYWEKSAGKTLAAVKLLEHHNLISLIVSPKSLHSKWKEYGNNKHIVITKERVRDSLEDIIKQSIEGNVNALLIDESHFFHNPTSQLYKNLIKYLQAVSPIKIYLLSATPYLSTAWNYYAIAQILGVNVSYHKFRLTFFHKVNMGMRSIWQQNKGEKHDALLSAFIKPLVSHIPEEVVLDELGLVLPKQELIVEKISLTEDITNTKRLVQEDGIGRFIIDHTIENGFYTTITGTKDIKNNKISFLLNDIPKNKKVAVIARYTYQIENIKKELESIGRKVYTVSGKTKDVFELTERVDNLKDNCVIIIQSAISEGYELPSFEHVYFMSLPLSYKDYDQMKGRFLRYNKPTPTRIKLLITEGKSIDKLFLKALENKESFYRYVSRELGIITKNYKDNY